MFVLCGVHGQIGHQINQIEFQVDVLRVTSDLLLALVDLDGVLDDARLAGQFEFLLSKVVVLVLMATLTRLISILFVAGDA